MKYIGHEIIASDFCIYLEYMSGGNITKTISTFGALPEKTIKFYTKQILLGLQYLHSKHIIHKDIKSANVLVDSKGVIKISDFGCAKQIEKTLSSFKIANTIKGSILWMAPEVIKESIYTYKSDIWSARCTVLEMATGKQPWSEKNFENPFAALLSIGSSDDTPHVPDELPEKMKSFLKCCFQCDMKQRYSADDLLSHQFLSNI